MIKMRGKVKFDDQKVLKTVRTAVGGPGQFDSAIVGPTLMAWYGKLHEFGSTIHPPRPFMRPALTRSIQNMPELFKDLIASKKEVALKAAAMIVEMEAKTSMREGGGRLHVPSLKGTPPHVQTGNLRNSIKYALTKKGM